MRISSHEIDAFLKCRVYWNYTSYTRRNLEANVKATPLALGSLVHDALETFYSQREEDGAPISLRDCLDECRMRLIATGKELELEDEALAIGMLQGYADRYGDNPWYDATGLSFLRIEQEIAVPIPDTKDGVFVGRIDALVRDSNNDLWVLDTKTYSRAPDMLTSVLNTQFTGYTWALRCLAQAGALEELGVPRGEHINGVLFNGLRKQLPGPRVKSALFIREQMEFAHAPVAEFERIAALVHDEMANPDVRIYPTPSLNCAWCSFKYPCIARRMGDDEEHLLSAGYHARETKGSVYVDEDVPG